MIPFHFYGAMVFDLNANGCLLMEVNKKKKYIRFSQASMWLQRMWVKEFLLFWAINLFSSCLIVVCKFWRSFDWVNVMFEKKKKRVGSQLLLDRYRISYLSQVCAPAGIEVLYYWYTEIQGTRWLNWFPVLNWRQHWNRKLKETCQLFCNNLPVDTTNIVLKYSSQVST